MKEVKEEECAECAKCATDDVDDFADMRVPHLVEIKSKGREEKKEKNGGFRLTRSISGIKDFHLNPFVHTLDPGTVVDLIQVS